MQRNRCHQSCARRSWLPHGQPQSWRGHARTHRPAARRGAPPRLQQSATLAQRGRRRGRAAPRGLGHSHRVGCPALRLGLSPHCARRLRLPRRRKPPRARWACGVFRGAARRDGARKNSRPRHASCRGVSSSRSAMIVRVLAVFLLLLLAPPAAQAQLRGHGGPVRALAISPDGSEAISGSFDTSAIRWSLPQNAAEQMLRISPLAGGGAPTVVPLPSPLNAVAVAPDGEIVTAGADGKVYVLSSAGELIGAIEAAQAPIIAVALSRDGSRIAAAGIRGSVAIIDLLARKVERTLVGPGLPVWSAAFFPDGRTLLTGGSDRMIRRWDAVTGEPIGNVVMGAPEDPLAAFAGDPGAEVFRACVACHTLKADEGVRAGPTLAGVFGRKIATLPGYNFSEALKKFNIVWTPETVAKLFEIGPAAYTPSTKMPEQRIGSAEDREALVRFLERATKAN